MLLKIQVSLNVTPFVAVNSLRRFEVWLCLHVQNEIV